LGQELLADGVTKSPFEDEDDDEYEDEPWSSATPRLGAFLELTLHASWMRQWLR
jgi:hypothetical protein